MIASTICRQLKEHLAAKMVVPAFREDLKSRSSIRFVTNSFKKDKQEFPVHFGNDCTYYKGVFPKSQYY